MEQIKAMLEAMKNDASFNEEMLALIEGGNSMDIIGLAAKRGFAFAEADWQTYIDMQKAQSANFEGKELSPEELDRVAGGSATENRYDEEECANILMPCRRCFGNHVSRDCIECEHYRQITVERNAYGNMTAAHCICRMGRFDRTYPVSILYDPRQR